MRLLWLEIFLHMVKYSHLLGILPQIQTFHAYLRCKKSFYRHYLGFLLQAILLIVELV